MSVTREVVRTGLLLSLCLLGFSVRAAEMTTASSDAGKFVQDRFAISFWVDPPADADMEHRYQEIADANFTLVLGGFGATKPADIRKQLDLCQKLGMKAVVSVPDKKLADAAADHPALWGYMWTDEPGAGAFAGLARVVADTARLRPGKLLFINLLPDYASTSVLGTATYQEYVKQFADVVKPGVLCMDYYPMFVPNHPDGRDGYCGNLAALRTEALRTGIPFWNFFNTMPYGPHTDPTEAQLRWQVYASAAYGAKGVLYFCYYTPDGGEFPKGGAIIGRDNRPTRHYDQAKRINAELKNLGPTLMNLTSARVVRVKPDSVPSDVLKGGPIRNLGGSPGDPKPDYLVGEFTHKDGRRAVLLQNYQFAYTARPTVDFDAPVDSIREIDKATGHEVPVHDDSPDIKGTQISLDAGEGRLFLLPAKAK